MTKPTHEIRALWLIFKRETTYILGNKQQRMVVLVAPFAYAILMSFVYIRHQVTDMPVAVARLEDSSYARQMVRMLEASPKMTIAYQVNSEQEIHELLLEGKVDAGVVLPRTLRARHARAVRSEYHRLKIKGWVWSDSEHIIHSLGPEGWPVWGVAGHLAFLCVFSGLLWKIFDFTHICLKNNPSFTELQTNAQKKSHFLTHLSCVLLPTILFMCIL